MKKYCHFFQTLHDEQSPTGYLGRGTHYSTMRAVVFHDSVGQPTPFAQFSDFAVIWDEDHDERVFEPIETLYRRGLLSRFVMFGERKGIFTAILADPFSNQEQAEYLENELNVACQSLDSGDSWIARFSDIRSSGNSIIDDDENNVDLYLQNISMLWELGVKIPTPNEVPFNPALLRKMNEFDLSIRASHFLTSNGILRIGDLVQMTEPQLLRIDGVGRKLVDELKDALATIHLHLGMDLKNWPPKFAKTIPGPNLSNT